MTTDKFQIQLTAGQGDELLRAISLHKTKLEQDRKGHHEDSLVHAALTARIEHMDAVDAAIDHARKS